MHSRAACVHVIITVQRTLDKTHIVSLQHHTDSLEYYQTYTDIYFLRATSQYD